MKIIISENPHSLGEAAGKTTGALIRDAIEKKGQANIILATGTSQFETINQLIKEDIDWSKVVMFHLDEYIGLPITEPASFRKYLKERFLEKVSPLKEVFLINGENNVLDEIKNLQEAILKYPIDVALVGVGENGHLAFNDPPADFDTEDAYLVVDLDDKCRMQQFGEGWFKSFDDVPTQAISMSVKQIMKSEHIICSVPDERKAQAVKDSIEQPVNNIYPATILQQHKNCSYYLDKESSSLLAKNYNSESV